jgi:hypothetical protein
LAPKAVAAGGFDASGDAQPAVDEQFLGVDAAVVEKALVNPIGEPARLGQCSLGARQR